MGPLNEDQFVALWIVVSTSSPYAHDKVISLHPLQQPLSALTLH